METQTTPNTACNQEWERRKELEQAVLAHLMENGAAKKWGALYSHFYQDERGEIGEALAELTQERHILVESDGTARLTVSGVDQLYSVAETRR
ncbi:MAG: hypothetical protein HXY51_02040 [Nitrospirae bacterium]|nr:hypothetical protein [Nitrospirota bacterium]